MAITPYLLYEDVDAAMKFLSKAFGFRRYGRPMKNAKGKTNHAAMQLGESLIMMGYPGPKYKNPRRVGHATQMLYIDMLDVDNHCERARKAGAKIVEEPKDTFYGARRYGAEDPEGHLWFFAEAVKKKSRPKTRAKRAGA